MEIIKKGERFEILVSRDELGTLGNCLNEALEAVNPFEFQTRVGVEKAEVILLLEVISKAYGQA